MVTKAVQPQALLVSALTTLLSLHVVGNKKQSQLKRKAWLPHILPLAHPDVFLVPQEGSRQPCPVDLKNRMSTGERWGASREELGIVCWYRLLHDGL